MKKAETIVAAQCALGEGPIWDDIRQCIFWVDILGKKVHWSGEEGEDHRTFDTPDFVSNIFLTDAGDDLILALPDALYLWNPESECLEIWAALPSYNPDIRTNDGFCDVHGHLWIGTMALSEEAGMGKLFMLDKQMKWHVMLDRTSISNGIRCLPDGHTYYFIDTPTQKIREFAFDPESLTWAWTRDVIEFPVEQGHPDGMSMDEKGRLWVSLWNGYGVVCVDPDTGRVTDRIEVAAPQVSANIFGGRNRDRLYISSARKLLPEEQLEAYPLTGDLFQFHMEVKGGPTYRRKMGRGL